MKTTFTREKKAPVTSQHASAGPDGVAVAAPIHDAGSEQAWHDTWQGQDAGVGVVQRVKWFGKSKKKETPYQHLPEDQQEHIRIQENIARQEYRHERHQNVVPGPSFNFTNPQTSRSMEHAYEAIATHSQAATKTPAMQSGAEKTRIAGGGVSKVGTVGTQLGQVIGNNALGTTGRITGGTGAGAGVVGSLLEAGLGVHDIATSDDKKKDKAIKGVDVLGSLANAAGSGASGIKELNGLVSGVGNLSGIASTVAAPASIAKGGADVISGLATGGLAHYRSNKLQKIQDETGGHGIARFAQESQWNKAKSNYGKAAGGALSVVGGALLLALGLSNPIGWGLLAAGGLAGLGVAGYRMYQKHKQGKELDKSEYRSALWKTGVNVPDKEELGKGGWKDILKTKSMRRQERVRGLIATKLAQNEQGGDSEILDDVSSYLGVSKAPEEGATSALLPERRKQKSQRAKSYARALDY